MGELENSSRCVVYLLLPRVRAIYHLLFNDGIRNNSTFCTYYAIIVNKSIVFVRIVRLEGNHETPLLKF